MDHLGAKSYKARRYFSGSSDFEPITVSIRDDEFHIVDSNGGENVLPMHTVSLKLGGSGNDRVVLEIQKSGDTLIVNDLEFLKVLQQAQATSHITRQVSRAQTTRSFDKLRGYMLWIVVGFVCLLFGGCIFVAVVLEPQRASHEKGDSASADIEGSETDAQRKGRQEEEYQREVKSILLKAWTPPPKDLSTATVNIVLGKDGTVKSTRIVESGGSDKTDQSALAAVKNSSPLPAPPDFWTEPIQLEFRFNPLDKISGDNSES